MVVSFHGFSYCITFRFGALHSGIHYNISFWGKTIGEFSALFYKQSTSTYHNLWQEIEHILFGTTNFAIFTLTESLCAFFPNSLLPNFVVFDFFGFFVLFVDEQLKLCEWTWTNVQKLCHFQIVLIENERYSIGKSFKWKWQRNINKALPKNVYYDVMMIGISIGKDVCVNVVHSTLVEPILIMRCYVRGPWYISCKQIIWMKCFYILFIAAFKCVYLIMCLSLKYTLMYGFASYVHIPVYKCFLMC